MQPKILKHTIMKGPWTLAGLIVIQRYTIDDLRSVSVDSPLLMGRLTCGVQCKVAPPNLRPSRIRMAWLRSLEDPYSTKLASVSRVSLSLLLSLPIALALAILASLGVGDIEVSKVPSKVFKVLHLVSAVQQLV